MEDSTPQGATPASRQHDGRISLIVSAGTHCQAAPAVPEDNSFEQPKQHRHLATARLSTRASAPRITQLGGWPAARRGARRASAELGLARSAGATATPTVVASSAWAWWLATATAGSPARAWARLGGVAGAGRRRRGDRAAWPVACLAMPSTGSVGLAALRPLPRSVMGVPLDLDALARSGTLSEAGLERVRAEPSLPPTELDDDVSVGDLVAARLGDEVVDRLVEPLLGGVYAGHARELSARATTPQLVGDARPRLPGRGCGRPPGLERTGLRRHPRRPGRPARGARRVRTVHGADRRHGPGAAEAA